MNKLGIKRRMFGEIIMPGTRLVKLLPSIPREINADSRVEVIVPTCHNTGSAVAAVPAFGSVDYAYISSGTWSLIWIEIPTPIINEESYKFNFTNEGSAASGFRFLKNIAGLWILQECKKYWKENVKLYSYDELIEMALNYGTANFKIDPDNPRFFTPNLIDENMTNRIKVYCRETEKNSWSYCRNYKRSNWKFGREIYKND